MTVTTTMPLAVKLTGIHKNFRQVRAVRGLDIQIESGEIVAILGPNGAGKTTTIDMILGLSQPTKGEVSVYDMQPREAIGRGLVSAVMQTGGLLKDLTVAETVEYTRELVRPDPGHPRGPEPGGHCRDRGPPRRQMLGRRAAAVAVRARAATRPRTARAG